MTATKFEKLEQLRGDALDLLLEEAGSESNVEQVLYWIVSTLNRLLNEHDQAIVREL